MPYLFRQSPLNAIWEGSGNVICLDVLRSSVAEPEYGGCSRTLSQCTGVFSCLLMKLQRDSTRRRRVWPGMAAICSRLILKC
jgi:hypothetical protein